MIAVAGWTLALWVGMAAATAVLLVVSSKLRELAVRARFRRWLDDHPGVPRDWWDEIHGGGRG